MELMLRDDRGHMHPIFGVTDEEKGQFVQRCWRTNYERATEIGLLPTPIYGMEKFNALAA
jgi:hypothetical protein